MQELRNAMKRSQDTLLADAFGCAGLVVLLVASLYLPSFF